MKNRHIVLLILLFANSFIFSANPAPDKKKEEDKGTFDRCFDGPGGFAKCAGVGALVVGGTGLAIWASGGVLSPWMTRIGGGISNAFESTPTPKPSEESKPAAAPKQVAVPKAAPAPKQEQKKPDSPRRDDDKKSWREPVIAGAGFMLGVASQTVGSDATRDIYDLVTGKKAKRDKEREEDIKLQREGLDIQRQLLDGQMKIHAENRKMHEEATEQHYKLGTRGQGLQSQMGALSNKLDTVFTPEEQ